MMCHGNFLLVLGSIFQYQYIFFVFCIPLKWLAEGAWRIWFKHKPLTEKVMFLKLSLSLHNPHQFSMRFCVFPFQVCPMELPWADSRELWLYRTKESWGVYQNCSRCWPPCHLQAWTIHLCRVGFCKLLHYQNLEHYFCKLTS